MGWGQVGQHFHNNKHYVAWRVDKRGVVRRCGASEIWSDDYISAQLSTTHKNSEIYVLFSKQLRERGFHRTVAQCHAKAKKLSQQYIQVRDALNRTGSCGQWVKLIFSRGLCFCCFVCCSECFSRLLLSGLFWTCRCSRALKNFHTNVMIIVCVVVLSVLLCAWRESLMVWRRCCA